MSYPFLTIFIYSPMNFLSYVSVSHFFFCPKVRICLFPTFSFAFTGLLQMLPLYQAASQFGVWLNIATIMTGSIRNPCTESFCLHENKLLISADGKTESERHEGNFRSHSWNLNSGGLLYTFDHDFFFLFFFLLSISSLFYLVEPRSEVAM